MLAVWYTRRSFALMIPPGIRYIYPWVVRHALDKPHTPGVDRKKERKRREYTFAVYLATISTMKCLYNIYSTTFIFSVHVILIILFKNEQIGDLA